MTPTECRKLVAITLAACPTAASFLDEIAIGAMAEAWMLLLGDVDATAATAALKRALAEGDGKIPAPGQIRKIVDESRHGRRRHGADAWGDVLREIGATGRYRDPRFADPVTARCVDRLGWRELCDSANAVADRARFVQLYDQLALEATSDRAVATLPGVARPARPAIGAGADAIALVASSAKRLGGAS